MKRWVLAAVLLVAAGWVGLTSVQNRLGSPGFRNAAAAAIERQSGRPVSLGALRLRLLPWPGVQADGLAVGDVLRVGHLSAGIAVWPLFEHVVRLRRLRLDAVSLNLVRDAGGRANWQIPVKRGAGARARAEAGAARDGPMDAATGASRDAAWDVQLAGIQVEGAELSWRDALLHRSGHLSLTRFAASGMQGERPLVELEGTAGGGGYRVHGTIGPLARLLDAGDRRSAWPVSLQASEMVAGAVVGRGRVTGTVADPQHGRGYDLSVSATMTRLDALNRLFPHAALPAVRDIAASAHLLDPGLQGAGAWLSSLRVKAGAARFADLLLQSWSLDAGTPAAPVAVTALGSWSGQRLTLDGTVASLGEIEGLSWRRPRLVDADLRLRAPPGGGAIDARLRADTRVSPATVNLSMHPVTLSAAALARLFGVPPGLRGEVELVGEVAASGESEAALRASISGHVGVSMVDGAVSNQVMSRLLGHGAVIAALLRQTGETQVRCFAAHAGLGAGSAVFDSLSAATGPISMSGRGRVGLADGALDLHLLADAGLGAASVSLPVRLQGSVHDPVVVLDAAAPKRRYVLTIGPSGPAAPDCAAGLVAAREGMAGPEPARSGKRKAPKPIDILRGLGFLQ